jgi:hypothetical protein
LLESIKVQRLEDLKRQR